MRTPLTRLAAAALGLLPGAAAAPAAAQGQIAPTTVNGVAALAPMVGTLNVTIETGDDDLRHDSGVFVGLQMRSGETLEVPFARGERLVDRSVTIRSIKLPRDVFAHDIVRAKVRFAQGPGGGLTRPDGWKMNRVTILGVTPDGRTRPLAVAGPNAQHFTASNTWEGSPLAAKLYDAAPARTSAKLCMRLLVGRDDLRGDSGATIQTEYVDGRVFEARFIGRGGEQCVPIPPAYADRGLRATRVRMSRGGGNFARGPLTAVDKADFDGVELAVETDGVRRPLHAFPVRMALTGAGVWESAPVARTAAPAFPPMSAVRVRLLVGNYNLDGRADVGVELADNRVLLQKVGTMTGSPVTVTPPGMLVENTSTQLAFATADTWVRLPPGTTIGQIRRVFIRYEGRGPWPIVGAELAGNANGAVHRIWSNWKVDYPFRSSDTWRSDVLPTFGR